MKKILFILLVMCLSFATVKEIKGANYIQIDVKAEQIIPNKRLNQSFQDILPFTKMDFVMVSGSVAVTTASVQWTQQDGTLVSTNVLTSGTPITNFLSNWASIVFINGAVTRNFTGIIRVIK